VLNWGIIHAEFNFYVYFYVPNLNTKILGHSPSIVLKSNNYNDFQVCPRIRCQLISMQIRLMNNASNKNKRSGEEVTSVMLRNYGNGEVR